MPTKKRTSKKKSTRKKATRRVASPTPRGASTDWTRKDSDVSAMSEADFAQMLGYRANQTELAKLRSLIAASEQFDQALSTPRFAAPVSVDWRSNNGNWVSPIRNQLSCGSCVSFATVGTIESRLKIVHNDSSRNDDFSEAHLFFCGCGQCCGTGWNFAPSLDFAQNTGLAPESAWPYQPVNQPCNPNVTPTFKISGWKRVLSVADRKQSLATTGPMVAGMAVFSDFSRYGGGVYSPGSNQLVGYHAVVAIGYDDRQRCWICKNSWGAGWGENGFFRIAYGTCEMDTTFPFYEVSLPTPAPIEDDCRRYVQYLIRVLTAARTRPRFRACLRYYVCRKGPRPLYCSASYLRVIRSVLAVLRRCPQYRRPFCDRL